jgi:hypothetical protein
MNARRRAPASPHEVVRPFSVLVDSRAERQIGFTASSFSLGPRERGSWRVLSHRAEGARIEHRGHPLLGFPPSTGSYRISPGHRERPRDRSSFRYLPSPGVSFPTAITTAKEPFPPGFPAPRHHASSDFERLLTPFSPSQLPALSGWVAPGIHPSGPFSSRRGGASFRTTEPS